MWVFTADGAPVAAKEQALNLAKAEQLQLAAAAAGVVLSAAAAGVVPAAAAGSFLAATAATAAAAASQLLLELKYTPRVPHCCLKLLKLLLPPQGSFAAL
ncbi:hypothetical protein ETH_00028640 [Eimeria tenella]|uniref:Uncharacterized protein n=1 Tax=Eimeria tenella TaxID=5802 RepID=U6KR60_EIMTE|nr:hypothetical protein ETH_00028640 [Eimeria tenella]CDJ39408.1 hypothetical protein ETH_00028640 [Eimeria tenella]|eukprot:XP_013230163.1 hypothetical protein ETH_00028640 [Eimeria tenella]